MYTKIVAQVFDQTLRVTNIPKLASGGENEVRVEVTFDTLWTGFGKTAIFYRENKKNQVYHVVMKSDSCVIPREVMVEPGVVCFGILGTSGSTVRTTEVVALTVAQGAITGLSSFEPLPDVYRQVLAAYGTLTAAVATERKRIDNLTQLEEGSTTGDAELMDIRVGADGNTYDSAGTAVRSQMSALSGEVAGLLEVCVTQGENLYDPTLQTPDTISPHYWVEGAPYETTQYDSSYHCTAPIQIKPMTVYTIGMVAEDTLYTTKPWGDATSGVFFYDANGAYLDGTYDSTFTTPAEAAFMRFNYAILSGFTREVLNAKCMLVYGDTLPSTYRAYEKVTLKERVDALAATANGKPIRYSFDGYELKVAAAYTSSSDILVTLKKKGGNSIFDFYQFATFAAGRNIDSLSENDLTVLQTTGTDWHAPFVVKAVNNVNGDSPDSSHFTGGNHEYTNTGNGGTPTGRTASLRVFADMREVTNGSGGCNRLVIKWVNYIQATNTKKADGTGREVLYENHVLTFDGTEWASSVEVVPLEDVNMVTWYGLQGCGVSSIYKNIRYYGGRNRGEYNGEADHTTCGDNKATCAVCEGEAHRMVIEIDPTFDLGDRRYYDGSDGIFTQSYGKVYFNLTDNTVFDAGCAYSFRGKYRFEAVAQ